MQIQLASIAPRAGTGPAQQMLEDYVRRVQPFFHAEAHVYRTEAALLAAAAHTRGRTAPVLALLDSRGQQHSSEQLAELLRRHRDAGAQMLFFGVGAADGWSAAARGAADLLLSLGPITLPHELARVVLAEQIYRAGCILAGHPYHSGH